MVQSEEDRLAPQGKKPLLIVVTDAAQKLALESDRCVQILREAGHLDTTCLSCVVDLGNLPDGLNAVELEQYLRGNTGVRDLSRAGAALLPALALK